MLTKTLAVTTRDTMEACGVTASLEAEGLTVVSPLTGEAVASIAIHSADDATAMIATAKDAFRQWRLVPAPRRGELVRLFGEELRKTKEELGRMVSIEAGKSPSEGQGEVQEMIDICDFAVGLSRQLYGLTIATERPGHRMMETWHPLGVVGIITAFNFPCAPWAWNSALALVCGDPVLWKPSEKTPLTALACQAVLDRAIARFGDEAPEGLSQVLVGGPELGEALVFSHDVALISATGSNRHELVRDLPCSGVILRFACRDQIDQQLGGDVSVANQKTVDVEHRGQQPFVVARENLQLGLRFAQCGDLVVPALHVTNAILGGDAAVLRCDLKLGIEIIVGFGGRRILEQDRLKAAFFVDGLVAVLRCALLVTEAQPTVVGVHQRAGCARVERALRLFGGNFCALAGDARDDRDVHCVRVGADQFEALFRG